MSANEIHFRPVRPEEIEAIAEIAIHSWQPIYDSTRVALGDELFRLLHSDWETRKADQVRRAARHRPDCVYVTEVDGRIAGFTTFMLDEDSGVGEIGNNAVHPDFQGRGIGTFQHRQVLEIMKQRGMRIAKVTTGYDEAHAPARKSYQKVGFHRCQKSVTYFMLLDDTNG